MKKKCIKGGGYLSHLRGLLLIMKLTIILIFSGLITVSASIYSQTKKLTLDLNDVSILNVLKQIEKSSEFVFIYKNDVIDLNKKVNVKVEGSTIDEILNEIFKGSAIKYEIINKQIILTPENLIPSKVPKSLQETPQKKPVNGKVTDAKGDPIPGTSVIVKGTTIGSITNSNGEFEFDVPIDSRILSFSFVGYKPLEIPIGNKTTFSVIMEEQIMGIEEVVAVGYGTMKKLTMTGAISKLKGESLLTSPVSNITNSMQGKVTGVTSIQTNGQPGLQTADIFIRGRATFGDASAIVIVDGVERPDFGSMDPNEIESMTVLKDASSIAIFGIRGANGVVVITTKQGKEMKPKVSYSGNVAANLYIDFPERLDAYETAKLQNVGAHNSGKSTGWNFYWSDAELEHFKKQDLPYQYADVDWMKTIIRKYNMQTQHNINVQGGTKKVKYYVSAGYMYTDGILKEFPSTLGYKTTDSYKKYNFRSNLDYNVTKDLRISLKVGGTMENIYQPHTGPSLGYLFYQALNIPSNRSSVYTPDGHYAVGLYTPTSVYNNPVAEIAQTGYSDAQRNKLETSLDIDLKMDWLTKGLSFKTLLSYDNSMNSTIMQNAAYAAFYVDRVTGVVYKSPKTTYLDDTGLSAVVVNSVWGGNGALAYNLQSGFDYSREFGKHNLSGLARFTRRWTANASADAPYVYQGVVSRLTYNYDNKYLLEGSVAYNGSENFPKGKRYGIFPSGSVGYILSNESFFKENVSYMNFLKIRGSLGLVGNDKLAGGGGRYLYLDEYAVATGTVNWDRTGDSHPGNPHYFGQPNAPSKYEVLTHSRIGNPTITWEKGLKADVGIETGFFKDKIKLTADYFYEKRSDILMTRRTSLTSYGEDYPKVNRGIVQNQGYEIELNMRDKFGEFTLGLTASISHQANKVLEADDPGNVPDYQKVAGKRVGQYMGYSTAGFYNSQQEIDDSNNGVAGAWPKNTLSNVVPGDLKFVDYNHDGVINSLDKHPILTSNLPEYNYSFTPTISYKNFTLLLMFQGTMKSMSDYLLTYNYFGYMKDSWTPENVAAGKKIIWPAMRDDWNGPGIDPAYANDFVIKSNAYLKLRNVEFSYQVPAEFAKKLSMSSVRLYISGQNLATWSRFKDFYHVDPEVYIGGTSGLNAYKREYAYPLARTINFGVSVQF
ncbi:MAG: TonB-dependent receptor [Lentimicrobiaceae bacterium]|nr:TonB-dependent receptor [Lentimicrobiaceae bacterium]